MSIVTGDNVDQARMRRLQGSIPSSYTIFKVGAVTYAESNIPGGMDYNDAGAPDSATVIQSARNALTNGGKIYIKRGTYTINSTITLDDGILLEGEARPWMNQDGGRVNPVTFNWGGGANGAMFNTVGKRNWGLKYMMLDGDGIAGWGVKGGGDDVGGVNTNLASMEHVTIRNMLGSPGTGLDCGSTTTTMQNCVTLKDFYVEGCAIGIDTYGQMNVLYSGAVSGCTTAAIRMRNVGIWDFHDVCFSGNAVDILGAVTTNIVSYVFHDCYFENSTGGVLSGGASAGGYPRLAFHNCTFHTSYATSMFNYTNMTGDIYFYSPKFIASTASYLHVIPSTVQVYMDNLADGWQYVNLSGAGCLIVDGWLKRFITYNGGATQIIGTIPAGDPYNYLISEIFIQIGTAWDGTLTINIGDASDNDGFLPNASITKSTLAFSGGEVDGRGAYLWDTANGHHRIWRYSSSTAINAYVGGAGTGGDATVWLKIISRMTRQF